jgi:hypothetical protein
MRLLKTKLNLMFLNNKIKLTLLLVFTVLNTTFAQRGYDDDSRLFRFVFRWNEYTRFCIKTVCRILTE